MSSLDSKHNLPALPRDLVLVIFKLAEHAYVAEKVAWLRRVRDAVLRALADKHRTQPSFRAENLGSLEAPLAIQPLAAAVYGGGGGADAAFDSLNVTGAAHIAATGWTLNPAGYELKPATFSCDCVCVRLRGESGEALSDAWLAFALLRELAYACTLPTFRLMQKGGDTRCSKPCKAPSLSKRLPAFAAGTELQGDAPDEQAFAAPAARRLSRRELNFASAQPRNVPAHVRCALDERLEALRFSTAGDAEGGEQIVTPFGVFALERCTSDFYASLGTLLRAAERSELGLQFLPHGTNKYALCSLERLDRAGPVQFAEYLGQFGLGGMRTQSGSTCGLGTQRAGTHLFAGKAPSASTMPQAALQPTAPCQPPLPAAAPLESPRKSQLRLLVANPAKSACVRKPLLVCRTMPPAEMHDAVLSLSRSRLNLKRMPVGLRSAADGTVVQPDALATLEDGALLFVVAAFR